MLSCHNVYVMLGGHTTPHGWPSSKLVGADVQQKLHCLPCPRKIEHCHAQGIKASLVIQLCRRPSDALAV